EELSWHPYHSHDDLLWCFKNTPPEVVAPTAVDPSQPDEEPSGESAPGQSRTQDTFAQELPPGDSALEDASHKDGSQEEASQSEPLLSQTPQENESSASIVDPEPVKYDGAAEPTQDDGPDASTNNADRSVGRTPGDLIGSYRLKLDSMFALAIA